MTQACEGQGSWRVRGHRDEEGSERALPGRFLSLGVAATGRVQPGCYC